MSDEEAVRRHCLAMIAQAQREYQDAIRPWVNQLVRMESMSLRPITIRPNIEMGAVISIAAYNEPEVE